MTMTTLLVGAMLTLAPESANAGRDGRIARNHFARGMKALDAGDTLAASVAFAKAAKEAPDWGLAHLQWGIAAQLYEPESSDVITALERAVELDRENARANYHLALAYERSGRHQEAATHLQQTLRARPDYPRARFTLARNLAASGDDTAAVEAYHQVLGREARHTGALVALADIYERTGRTEAAEAMLRRLTVFYHGVPYHHLRLARFYDRIGDAERAREARDVAESLNPKPKRTMRPLRKRRRR
ncbi:MAG: tetratricopeptide repeat protein [Myxococcota bacterium]